jgi:ectoine hydroxylase-related dioxygenase (phytanoyl-CoA dioxygenase family)
MDRGSFKPPVTTGHSEYHDESPIHWDRDPRVSSPYPVQGVLYLTDTADTQGAFQCVPELYRSLDQWLVMHSDDANTGEPDVSGYPLVRVGALAGSLVIWNSLLPHGTGRNWANKPRLAQYIMMYPIADEAARQERIAFWQQKRVPEVWRRWPGQLDPEPGEPAVLTLGRKLLGLDLW